LADKATPTAFPFGFASGHAFGSLSFGHSKEKLLLIFCIIGYNLYNYFDIKTLKNIQKQRRGRL